MLPGKEIFLLFIGSFLVHLSKATNTKQMYALCPPDFFGIGTECYFISQKKVNWLDAHFDCKDRKSRLAEPNRYEDRMIRRFLVNNDLTKASKWIGGNYNWAQKKWQWQDGKEFMYQSFSQMAGGVQELKYHCAILNPDLKYRWSASSCVDKHQYICQHRMPYVNEKHRSRIYTRWNQTYPNEQATQVEVILNDTDMLKRGHRQSIPVNGRSTNTQRLSRHRNYLAGEWLKKYRSQQIVINRNAIPNEINLIDTQARKVPQRPNRLTPRRRNPSIGRDDFIQFEKKKHVNRGPLITNKVDDFDKQETYTRAWAPAPTTDGYQEQTRQPSRVEVVTSSPARPYRVDNEFDLKEKKRLEDTKKWLETGRYEHAYTRRRIPLTTTATTSTTESSVGVDLEGNRDHEERRQQEEDDQERQQGEETRRYEQSRRDEVRRREEERRRMEEKRIAEQRQDEERRIEAERMQNQINEETLRFEHEEQLRRSRLEQEEQRRAEEKKRIHEEHTRDREEKIRLRGLELKEREEEEQRIREDEERRQDENRQRLEEIERQQREEEERKRQEVENQRIEEENRRRRKEEQRNKQKMRQNQADVSEEEALSDLRLKEKVRKEKLAKLRERIKNLSPEDQLKFFELRGKRNKKHSDGTENETATNQV